MSKPTTRTRSFCFTLNNWTDEEFAQLCDLSCRYLVIGKEHGDGGTPHLQGYVEFNEKVTMGKLKKINKRIHWETRRGTPKQAALYCKKEGNYTEFGLLSQQGQRTDIEEVIQLVQSGRNVDQVIIENPRTSLHCQRALRELAALQQRHRTEKPTCVWLFGKSGVGKTKWVFDEFGQDNVWIKWNHQWDGYEHQDVILIDDFRPVFGQEYADFLRLCDRYPYMGRVLYGTVKVNSPWVYVTAPHHPSEWYCENELTEITRRFDHIIEVLCNTEDELHYIEHK